MLNVYKKEFTVASLSEVKNYLNKLNITLTSHIFTSPKGLGIKHLSEVGAHGVQWNNSECKQIAFILKNQIDFINFDE